LECDYPKKWMRITVTLQYTPESDCEGQIGCGGVTYQPVTVVSEVGGKDGPARIFKRFFNKNYQPCHDGLWTVTGAKFEVQNEDGGIMTKHQY
ncbi:hypothetical protein, partial [Staphylococcus aureus]|uniref:hypothetical protein n=1 Tax=Staphylococcus aureus TaxID=1280 RepID=UPI0038B3320A